MKTVLLMLLVVVLILAVWAFSSCRSIGTGGGVELTFFSWPFPKLIQVNKERLAIFEKENPDIKVKMVTGDEAKYLTMTVGGVAPDVGSMDYGDIAFYAKHNIIWAMDEFIEKDKDFSLDKFFPAAVESARYKDKLYMLADTGSPVALIYNKDMFDRYNDEHPDGRLDYPNEDWTWEDFRRAAIALTRDLDGDGQIDTYGVSIGFHRNRFPMYVWQCGGQVLSKDLKRCLMDTPEAIRGIRWMYQLVFEDKCSPSSYTQMEGASQQTDGIRFQEQKIAMLLTTRYTYGNLLGKTTFKWDIALLPKGPVNRTSVYIGGGWVISKQTRYPEQAWRLARFLVSDKACEMAMLAGRGVTTNRPVAERMLNAPGVEPEHDNVWVDAMDQCRPNDFEIFRVPMGSYFDRAMDEIYEIPRGRRQPEEACRNFTRIFNEGLDKIWKEGGP